MTTRAPCTEREMQRSVCIGRSLDGAAAVRKLERKSRDLRPPRDVPIFGRRDE